MDKNKKIARIRRAASIRSKLYKSNTIRLVVHRTIRHIYAQVITPHTSEVIVSASTVEQNISQEITNTGNKNAATAVGKKLAERALEKGIKNVSFDRSGYQYHGRVQALADAAREAGLKF